MRRVLAVVGLFCGCDQPHLIATGSPDGSVPTRDGSSAIPPDASGTAAPDAPMVTVDPQPDVVWVEQCAFAFDYEQRTASGATMSSAVLFTPTRQLVAGEAGAAFVTSDAWTSNTRVCPTLTGDVRDLVRLDDQHALAISSRGSLALSAKSGLAWTPCVSTYPIEIDLRAATVVNVTTAATTTTYDVLAVGAGGTMLRGPVTVGTHHACGPFVAIASPTTRTLFDVAADPQTGIVVAVGLDLARSTDFGKSFAKLAVPDGYNAITAVTSLGGGAGFLFSGTQMIGAPASPRILSSPDGAALVRESAFPSDIDVQSVTAVDATHAWIFGRGYGTSSYPRISFASVTGGAWSEQVYAQPSDAAFVNPLGTLAALDSSTATWVAAAGQITSTQDGPTWFNRTRGDATSIYDLQFVGSSSTSLWATTSRGTVLRTDDAGGAWTTLQATDRTLTAIAAPSDQLAFAVGADGVIVRNSGTGFSLDPASFGTPSLVDIDCVDEARCYAVGLKRTFIQWDGTGWSTVPGIATGTKTIWAVDVLGTTPHRGVAVGAGGAVFTLVGDTWTEQAAIPGVDLSYVAMALDGQGLVLALGQTADSAATPVRYRSVDFGATWSLDGSLPELTRPRGITQDAAGGSWYMLGYATLYKGNPSGTAWSRLALPVSILIQNDVAARGGHVYTAGNVGIVTHSATGGQLP